MKTNAIVRIVLFALAVLILGTILVSFLFVDMYIADGRIHFDRASYISDGSEYVTSDTITKDIRNIEIEWVSGSITIQPDSNATDISVTEYAASDSEHQMVMKQSGQTLKIKFSEKDIKFPSFGIDADLDKDLVITVPADWECNSLEIDTASSEVMMNGLTIKEFDFDGASGLCSIMDCDITKIDIDTASGDVEFRGTLSELEFDAASARFHGEFLEKPKSLRMDTMSGDLDLVLPEDCGFVLDLSTMSGSFESDFPFTRHDETYISGEDGCRINISGMSGDVRILKAAQ